MNSFVRYICKKRYRGLILPFKPHFRESRLRSMEVRKNSKMQVHGHRQL